MRRALLFTVLTILACDGPLERGTEATVSGPEFAPPAVPGPPHAPADMVLEYQDGDATHSLSVPVAVFLAPGETSSARVVLTAGSQAGFDIVVGQRDSTAVVFEGTPIFYTRGLQTADETGLLADSAVVVPYIFQFNDVGSFSFELPFRAKSPGRSLVQVIWTFSDGTKLGLATIDVVVE